MVELVLLRLLVITLDEEPVLSHHVGFLVLGEGWLVEVVLVQQWLVQPVLPQTEVDLPLDEVVEHLDGLFVLQTQRKLERDAVLMFSYQRATRTVGQDGVVGLDVLVVAGRDVDWVDVPSVSGLDRELLLVVDSLEDPVVEVLAPERADLLVRSHDHHLRLQRVQLVLIGLDLLDLVSRPLDHGSLQRSFSPRVVHTEVALWLPFLCFVAIGVVIP